MARITQEMLAGQGISIPQPRRLARTFLPRVSLPVLTASRIGLIVLSALATVLWSEASLRAVAAVVLFGIVYFAGRFDGSADAARDFLRGSLRGARQPVPVPEEPELV